MSVKHWYAGTYILVQYLQHVDITLLSQGPDKGYALGKFLVGSHEGITPVISQVSYRRYWDAYTNSSLSSSELLSSSVPSAKASIQRSFSSTRSLTEVNMSTKRRNPRPRRFWFAVTLASLPVSGY